MTALPKKIWGAVLLLLVAVPVLFSAVFLIRQHLQQDQMQEKMEQSVLQTIHLKSDDVKWVSSGKEISIDGKLFDISTSSLKDGVYTFTGLFDLDEDHLISQYHNECQSSKHSNTPLETILYKYLTEPLFNSYTHHYIQHNCYAVVNIIYPQFTEDAVSAIQTIVAPPPKAA